MAGALLTSPVRASSTGNLWDREHPLPSLHHLNSTTGTLVSLPYITHTSAALYTNGHAN